MRQGKTQHPHLTVGDQLALEALVSAVKFAKTRIGPNLHPISRQGEKDIKPRTAKEHGEELRRLLQQSVVAEGSSTFIPARRQSNPAVYSGFRSLPPDDTSERGEGRVRFVPEARVDYYTPESSTSTISRLPTPTQEPPPQFFTPRDPTVGTLKPKTNDASLPKSRAQSPEAQVAMKSQPHAIEPAIKTVEGSSDGIIVETGSEGSTEELSEEDLHSPASEIPPSPRSEASFEFDLDGLGDAPPLSPSISSLEGPERPTSVPKSVASDRTQTTSLLTKSRLRIHLVNDPSDICYQLRPDAMSDDPLYTEIQGVTLDGKLWPSAFHIYLASRFPENLPIVEKLRNTRDVEVAKKLTNDATPLVAFSDWEEQDLNCLRDIIWGKFKVSPSLQDLLLITGRAELVFVDDDPVLGSGKDGKGLNMIGTVLMKTRTRLSKLAA